MRCLTLAEAFRSRGGRCYFVVRVRHGNLADVIRQRGFQVFELPDCDDGAVPSPDSELVHSSWLGCHWQTDAAQTCEMLASLRPNWVVVDHYALDARWERQISPFCERIFVIDDLADRHHTCDLLLDQTLGRTEDRYRGLVPDGCLIMLGPEHALLRQEFGALRQAGLLRRKTPALRHILITMGGVDQANAAGLVLRELKDCALPSDCRISVVMGHSAPWTEGVRAAALAMPWPTEVLTNVADMAALMVESDLAIGAAGGTAWERCCLGLPTLMIVLAENQTAIAESLAQAGAAVRLEDLGSPTFGLALREWMRTLDACPERLSALSNAAAGITRGIGTQLVVDAMVSRSRL